MNMKNNYAQKSKFSPSKLIIYIVLSIWGFTTAYPFFWVIINSFKQRGLIRSNSFSIPTGEAFSFDNYALAFERFNVPAAYRNSLVVTCFVTIVVVLLAGLAGYVLARYRFRGRAFVQGLVVASMMFPAFATVIPVFRMEFGWGIVNTNSTALSLLSVILPQIAGNLSFSIVVLTSFIHSVPMELEEAAYIEGYNLWQIFFKVVIPLAKSAFATVAIFTFLWSYNDLFTQKFFLGDPEAFTITLLLDQINSQAGVNYGLMCSAVVIIVIPVLIVYVFLQKNIIKGLTAGAIKG